MRRRAALAVAALVIAGCTVGPDYKRPALDMPKDFRGAATTTPESLGDLSWRNVFPDQTLQSLILTALVQNYDVRVAATRILDARAAVTVARSFQFPTVDGRAEAIYSSTAGDRPALTPRESFTPIGGLDFLFEIDLWGRFRRGTEAARGDLFATEENRRFVVTTLVSDVASAYFQLRALDEQLAISRSTLVSRRDSLRLINLRQSGGVASLIDVRQAEILVATAAQTVPDTERQIEQTENVISILLGRNPDAYTHPAQTNADNTDVRKWFGPLGFFSVGPSVTVPIFNMGRVAAGVNSAEARAETALLQYRQVVLGAFRDVADAIVEFRKRGEARVEQEAFTVAARDTARLANIRYRGGVASYLEVLDSERQLFDAELGLIATRRDELLAVVRLYKALGGGWQL